MAPWDIGSSNANTSFSTSSVKWNDVSIMGIQFRTPKKMIDYTRHGHNEIVSERLQYNEQGKYEKDIPQFVVWIKEDENENREEDDRWRMTKKAASQLGVPIVVIDREKYAIRETEKIKLMEEIFLGEKENTLGLRDEELLERMIVEFENNKTGLMYASEELKQKYFTDEKREKMIENIKNRIKEFEQNDPERYKICVKSMADILEGEINKGKSNVGHKIIDINPIFYQNLDEFNDKLRHLNENVQTNEEQVKMLGKKEERLKTFKTMQAINQTPYYDNNKLHSIEHIEKVIYFSSLLAKNEGLARKRYKFIISSCSIS